MIQKIKIEMDGFKFSALFGQFQSIDTEFKFAFYHTRFFQPYKNVLVQRCMIHITLIAYIVFSKAYDNTCW